MNRAQMTGMKMMADAMSADNNYAVQINIDGKWQMVIDKLKKNEATELAARYEQSRVVKVM